MRLLSQQAFIFLCIFAATSAQAEPRKCKAALSLRATSNKLEKEITNLALEQTDFPQYEAFKAFQKRYAKLNKDVDALMDGIREHMNSPVVSNTETLGKINADILARIQNIQKITSPGFLKQTVARGNIDQSRIAQEMHEVLFCRSQGENCLVGLHTELEELNQFHLQLKQTLEKVRTEIVALQNLTQSNAPENASVVSVMLRQIDSLKTTEMVFVNQMTAHNHLIDAVVLEMSTFENDLRNSMRLLFANVPHEALEQEELGQLNSEDNDAFKPGLRNFPDGTTVYALSVLNLFGRDRIYLDPVVVTGWNSDNTVQVKGLMHGLNWNDKTKLKEREEPHHPNDLAIQGCHLGFCTGDNFSLKAGKIWAERFNQLSKDRPNETYFQLVSFSDPHQITVFGYNPVRNAFLIKSDSVSGRYLWVTPSTLTAAKSRKLNPAGIYGDPPDSMMSGQIQAGDFVYTGEGNKFRVEQGDGNWLTVNGQRISNNRLAKFGSFHGIYSAQELNIRGLSKDGQVVLGYDEKRDSYLLEITDNDDWESRTHWQWIPREELAKKIKRMKPMEE